MDAGVALDQGIGVGDTVTLHNGDRQATYRVVGTAFDFTDCFYPQCDPGRNWGTEPGIGRLGAVSDEIINVRTTTSATTAAVAETLDATLGSNANVGANTWPDTRGDLVAEADFFAVFLGVFGA